MIIDRVDIMHKKKYLNPEELIEKYPDVIDKFHWSSRELGLFLKCKLLDGYFDRTRRVAQIKEKSFIELIIYTNSCIDNQKVLL